MPHSFERLLGDAVIGEKDIIGTKDGFSLVYKSLSSILAEKDIIDFKDAKGDRLLCERFFDDWFLYAVSDEGEHTYSLLKFREQEHDAEDGAPADGDTPGVTISFIAFDCEILLRCLTDPSEENRKKLNTEINRVVSYTGQRHHKILKKYFKNPGSQGAYLVADVYMKHIAAYAADGVLEVPRAYKALVQQSISYKNAEKPARLPRFIASLNLRASRTVCDNEYIYIENPQAPDIYEGVAILATHTGNTSVYSFGAEVEYHARFLTFWARIKIPFWGRSIYASAIRADMTVDDTEFEGPAPFYRWDSKIVKRQYALHREESYLEEVTI